MARFKRDEQRTYPIWWLIAGGLFIFSTAWAVLRGVRHPRPLAEGARGLLPDGARAREAGPQAGRRTSLRRPPSPKSRSSKARQDELKREQSSGKYAAAKAKLTKLTTRVQRRRAGQDVR